jgi:hypothetical protein
MNTLNRPTSHSVNYRLAVLCLALVCAGATQPLAAKGWAATLTVTSTADSGAGTLRAALKSSRNGDMINFAVTGTIVLTSGELAVSKNVRILGPGPGNLAVNGNQASRVFEIASGTTVTIAGLTITNGVAIRQRSSSVSDDGAGILNNNATLTVSNCVLTGNSAGNYGGGICGFASGTPSKPGSATLTVVNCTLSANTARIGAGLGNLPYSGSSVTLTVANSTLNGNTAEQGGGGIANDPGGQVTLKNSTLSGNSVALNGGFNGGGVENFGGIVTITSSTLTGNSVGGGSGYGGGIYNDGGTVTIGNTILNNNLGPFNSGNLYYSLPRPGTITSLGYNLSSDWAGGGLLNNATDRNNTGAQLGPLQDNGGPTFTHAPLPGSPAIDNGKNLDGSTTDQRGFARTHDDPTITYATGGDGTDIGAVEVQPVTLNATLSSVVVVEGSNDGTTWTPVTTINLSEGATYVPESSPKQFYRVRLQ